LEQQLASEKADKEKNHQRVDATMKLKDKELHSLRAQVETIEIEAKAARLECQMMGRMVSAKDEDILNERAATAALSKKVDELERMLHQTNNTSAGLREEIENRVIEQMEGKMLQMQLLHDAELATMTEALTREVALSEKRKDARGTELVSKFEELQGTLERTQEELDRVTKERNRLAEELKNAHKMALQQSSNKRSQQEGSLDLDSNEDIPLLKKRLLAQAEQLWTLGNEVSRLKSALDARPPTPSTGGLSRSPALGPTVSPTPTPSGDTPSVNQGYLRSVLVRFLSEKNDDVRGNILPVLATMLCFTTHDLKTIFAANPRWMS